MQVAVTEFVRPRGEQRPQTMTVADDCAVGYEAMRRHKCRLTGEYLGPTGLHSLCIEHEEGDYAIEIVSAEKARAAVEKMLREFDGAKFEEWLKEFQER